MENLQQDTEVLREQLQNVLDKLAHSSTDLNKVSETEQTLMGVTIKSEPGVVKSEPFEPKKKRMKLFTIESPPTNNSSVVTDGSLVQVRADKAEIERRINAFLENKKSDINEENRREFCNLPISDDEDSCARTGAVFIPRPGTKSHVPVSRVHNAHGPQTRPFTTGTGSPRKQHHAQTRHNRVGVEGTDAVSSAVDERLSNMETHLHINRKNRDVFRRIQHLEERLLYLEGLSPEYFNFTAASQRDHRKPEAHVNEDFPQRSEPNKQHNKLTISELDERINKLKSRLCLTDIKPEVKLEIKQEPPDT